MLGPVVIGVEGKQLTPADRRRLIDPRVGMVILFSANFESPEQLRQLTEEIHGIRNPPLLVAVDHEGGRVQRFRTGFTRLPAMRRLGRLWERDVLQACRVAASTGYVLAAELRAHGVDFTFAPVLDIDWGRSGVIGDRSFHADARVVAMLAAHLIHGLAMAGMANCGKHFPGHGWAFADSHVALPLDERSLDALLQSDAAPYRWLGPQLTAVMPAHVVYDQVDAAPAGFSAQWLQRLRREFGFAGAVFSDDLLMEGASTHGSVTERAQAALRAGCDLALVCNDLDAMEMVLRELRWTRSSTFDSRVGRITPCGPAPTMKELRASELYEVAKSDLGVLNDDE
ncbi:MAG TPA: beta-N-acetylhexosaminidase [Burkholderiaceae bacterium]|nr:beta-N-acetylhexosaminidase [Burkholderiaceae bacterium]